MYGVSESQLLFPREVEGRIFPAYSYHHPPPILLRGHLHYS